MTRLSLLFSRRPRRRPSSTRRSPQRSTMLAFGGAALLAFTPAAVAVTAQAAASGCQVDYSVTNQWPGGFGANVTITNLGDPIDGWTLTWSFAAGQQVVHAWNATVTQNGAEVTATNVDYNRHLPTGGNTSFGFNGSWNNNSNPAPTRFTLNGTVCTGAIEPTTGSPSPGPTTPSPGPTTPSPGPSTPPPTGALQMEDLNRGLISIRSGNGNFLSWRLLGTDPVGVAFNVYRNGSRVNSSPITNSTNYYDSGAPADASYTVRAVVNGVEQGNSEPALRFESGGYLTVPLQVPPGGSTPSGSYTYSAGDASVGDLDGDGQYEIVLKWDPSNARDNSQSGYTGNTLIDAYRLDGTRLWRIDLGRNIRSGAHYTQFQVNDYDGDGRAEVAMKTADGTIDGTGRVIGNASADYRNSSGYILSGPEYLTVFDGLTGAALSTVEYVPPRGNVTDWGDNYGNRVDRFLAGTAYLDGQRPSLIMARGYYTRSVIVAWDFRNGTLTRRWVFDSNSAGSQWTGQGTHSLSIADVDADGRQEIIYGAMTIDDNGVGMYSTRYGHGDALHVGDFAPSRPGLEVFLPHEASGQPAADLHDARTGAVLWRGGTNSGEGPGRGVAGDIYAGNPGAEMWYSGSSLLSTSGSTVGRAPSSCNFLVWWDADPVRELLDGNHIDKYGTSGDTRLLTGSGVTSINDTKATPNLSGDILGDWREEVIWRTSDSSALRIYSTTMLTDMRLYTLVHDAQYRVALAWQNTAYNQPPHPSYFIGAGMAEPPRPNIYVR